MVERLHNQVVLANIDALVRRSGVARQEITAVAFGAGPGSFTGIRIAAAVAQGVAFGAGGGVLPVSSSQALAAAAVRHAVLPAGARRVLTVTRSRRDAYYLAGFHCTAAAPERLLDDRLHLGATAPERLLPDDDPAGWVAVGDRPDWWPGAVPFVERVAVTAVDVGELARHTLARQAPLPPEAALPVYVAGDSPWRPQSS